jgi:hydroxyacylglutathione hydrolase
MSTAPGFTRDRLLDVGTYTVGAFQENCYLLVDSASRDAVLIDPGEEGARLMRAVEQHGATLTAIWLTHAHLDHIGGIAEIIRRRRVPIYMHPLDEPMYNAGARQAAHYGLPFDTPPAADHSLGEGDELALGALRFKVMHTPGHAPGHVVIHGHDIAFVGDCLFAGSIGRSDLPLSDPTALAASLERIAALPEHTLIYPGHGPATTIGAELRSNPFLTGAARIVGA